MSSYMPDPNVSGSMAASMAYTAGWLNVYKLHHDLAVALFDDATQGEQWDSVKLAAAQVQATLATASAISYQTQVTD